MEVERLLSLFLVLCLQFLIQTQVAIAVCAWYDEELKRSAPSKTRSSRAADRSRASPYRRTRRGRVALATTRTLPHYWVYPRSGDWWNDSVMSSWDDEEWLRNFRMTKGTFMWIASSLRPQLQRQDTNTLAALPVEKRMGIALWYLASGNSLHEVQHRFGVGLTTVAEAVQEFCRAMESVLLNTVVCFEGTMEQVMAGFAHLGFPQCIGAIDVCYIPIQNPEGAPGELFNRRRTYPMLLLATCDHKGRFYNMEVGYTGSYNASWAFVNSHFCKAMDRGVYFPDNPTLTVDGVNIPAVVLADNTFPMRRWLVKEYVPERNAREKHFNCRHWLARCVVEQAFDRLKANWRCLLSEFKEFRGKPDNVSQIVLACVVLHNICESEGRDAPESECTSGPLLSQLPEQEEIVVRREENCKCSPQDDTYLREGKAVRDALSWFMQGSRDR